MRRGLSLSIALLCLAIATPASAFFCFSFSGGNKSGRAFPPPGYFPPPTQTPYIPQTPVFTPVPQPIVQQRPQQINGWNFRPLSSRRQPQ